MIIHYGYEDGSGKYYVSIDAGTCDACNACIEQCPENVLTTGTVMIDIEDKVVAVVEETQRKKLNFACASCHRHKDVRCAKACKKGAITATWARK